MCLALWVCGEVIMPLSPGGVPSATEEGAHRNSPTLVQGPLQNPPTLRTRETQGQGRVTLNHY